MLASGELFSAEIKNPFERHKWEVFSTLYPRQSALNYFFPFRHGKSDYGVKNESILWFYSFSIMLNTQLLDLWWPRLHRLNIFINFSLFWEDLGLKFHLINEFSCKNLSTALQFFNVQFKILVIRYKFYFLVIIFIQKSTSKKLHHLHRSGVTK